MSTYLLDENLRKKILAFSRMPRISIEKARIFTDVLMQTEKEPMIIRRAKAFRKLVQEISISIEDWQLIVGSPSSDTFTVLPFREGDYNWLLEIDTFETREGDKYFITEEDKNSLKEILSLWRGKSLRDKIWARLPEEVMAAYGAGLIESGYIGYTCGNFSPNYQKLLTKGICGIMEDIKEKMAQLDLANSIDHKKRAFYKAAIIACEGVMDYATRYSKLAKELAEKEKDAERKTDLLTISNNCARVPAYPARNFPEALQSFWLLHALFHLETGANGIVAGRMDQYLYPYYLEDKKEKRAEEAKKWLRNLWINKNQIMHFSPKRESALYSGHPVSEQPTIGGITEEGKDASNELTKLILEVEKEVGLPRPDVAVMYHKEIDKEVLHIACEALPKATKPKFFNYDIARKHLLAKGATEEEVRRGAVVIGCVSAGIEGKTWGHNNMVFFNLGKCLELALNNGVDLLGGKKIGLSTGDVTEFKTFEDLMNAFKIQVRHAIKTAVTLAIAVELVHQEVSPYPLVSVFVDDCVERGLNVWDGGARYNIPGIEGVGLANVADALAAVKKLVFDKNEIGMGELIEALHDNWEGKENLRAKLINDAPKFGNDEDYVDEIAVEVAKHLCEEISKYKSPRGEPYYPGLYSVSAHVGLGEHVGATPDGRSAKTPLADGTSPAQGVIFQGPTAVLRSMTKIDHSLATSGTLLNMKFSPSTLRKHESEFLSLLRSFMELGGYHVQFNIVDTDILKDAQRHPEKYSGLLVRVAAYAAEFTALPKRLQDDIIDRSELAIG